MLKSTELRLGNLVSARPNIEVFKGKYDTVRLNIHHLTDIVESNDQYIYEPIPLTGEWLLKFGFEYNDLNGDSGYYQIVTKNGIFEILYSEESGRFSFNNQYIDFVHTLQNIFYFNVLTGEELTI